MEEYQEVDGSKSLESKGLPYTLWLESLIALVLEYESLQLQPAAACPVTPSVMVSPALGQGSHWVDLVHEPLPGYWRQPQWAASPLASAGAGGVCEWHFIGTQQGKVILQDGIRDHLHGAVFVRQTNLNAHDKQAEWLQL